MSNRTGRLPGECPDDPPRQEVHVKPLNVAVAGCGYWGPNLIRNLVSLQGCRMKWVCDVDPKRIAHMNSPYPGIEATPDFEVMVNDPEIAAVVIATPVHLHHGMA